VLAGREGNRLFIACNEAERSALSHQWRTLKRITSFVTVQFIDIGDAGAQDEDRRLLDAQRAVAALSIKDNAFLSVLDPDLLLSDGTIARVIDLARSGYDAVLASAFPVDATPLEARLVASRTMLLPGGTTNPPRRALHLSTRSVAQHALAVRDPSLDDQDWDGGWKGRRPLRILHRAPGGFVIQSADWTVLLIDLGAVPKFKSGNLPDDFLERALVELHRRERIHCVTDSDELAILRLQDASREPQGPIGPVDQPMADGARETEGLARLADALNDPALHPVVRQLLQVPVRWHDADLSPIWGIIADRARSLVVSAERDATPRRSRAVDGL
jgi:hypothetical protein